MHLTKSVGNNEMAEKTQNQCYILEVLLCQGTRSDQLFHLTQPSITKSLLTLPKQQIILCICNIRCDIISWIIYLGRFSVESDFSLLLQNMNSNITWHFSLYKQKRKCKKWNKQNKKQWWSFAMYWLFHVLPSNICHWQSCYV